MAAELDGVEVSPLAGIAMALNSAWALVAEHPRVDVGFWALAVAAKMDVVNGRSSRQFAETLGVTEADFSKTVNRYCDLLALPRPPSLKSQRAREQYSRVQRENHWRDRSGLDYVLRNRRDQVNARSSCQT